MSKLKYKQENVYTVEYHDFEKFVFDLLKVDYELPATEECSNDVVLKHRITLGEAMDEYDQKRYDAFVEGKNPSYILRTLLQKFCNEGLIPEGTYMINVSW